MELAAVCDANPERAAELAMEFKTQAFTTLDQLIKKSGIHAATVAVPTIHHLSVARTLMEAGIDVLIEKPLATTLDEADELIRLAKMKHRVAMVGHLERFNPAVRATLPLITHPMFFEVHRLSIFSQRALDVDVVLDLMIHDLDIVLCMVNSPVKDIRAVGLPILSANVDIANVRLEFESGCVANLTASRVSMNGTRKFRVFQPDQYLSIDFDKGEIALTTKTGEWENETIPLQHNTWSLQKTDAILEEIKAFVDSILNDKPVPVSGEDAVGALELAERILEDIQRRHL